MKNKIQDEENTPETEAEIDEKCCCIPKKCCTCKNIGICSLILLILIGIIVVIIVFTAGDQEGNSEPIKNDSKLRDEL
jgi:hypothetical protein